MIEGSGSGSRAGSGSGSKPLASGSGSGSRRPKNMWIRWIRFRIRIRIRNTALYYEDSWGQILGRNWDKSLFTVTSTNGFTPPPPSKSGLKMVCNVNIVTRKAQVWELSRLFPDTSTKLYVYEFGFCFRKWDDSSVGFPRAHTLSWPTSLRYSTSNKYTTIQLISV